MTVRAAIESGWLTVPYDGHDLARVRIGVGKSDPDWFPAFLDYNGDGQRVAKIRPPAAGRLTVWLSVGHHVTQVGTVTV